MTEISFHFNVPDKMAYACRVLRKAVNSGNKVMVAAEPSTLAQLDIALWTFTPLDFIPHCSANSDASLVMSSPVVLGDVDAPGTHRQVLLNMGSSVAVGFERFEKLIELVTNDEDDRQTARIRWKHYASRGYNMTRHDLTARAANQPMIHTPSPRPVPRFLPTLTEVVHMPAEAVQPVNMAPEPEQLVGRVMQRLDGSLKAAVQASINDMVREQLQILEPILMREVELAVRQAVLESLSSSGPLSGHTGPPYTPFDPTQ